jgi:hypothetical protein
MEQKEYEMSETDILKKNVYDLQKQLQEAYRRIGELREALEVEVQKNDQSFSFDWDNLSNRM